jgi:hypothetical protein
MTWRLRARLWLPWILVPGTVLLALAIGREALLLWCVFGACVASYGVIYIAKPSAWVELVQWRQRASSLALWSTGFTRGAEHENRVVAGAMHIVVGLAFAVIGVAGATVA